MRKWIAIAILGLGIFIAARSRTVKAQQTAYSQTITNQYGTFTNSVTVNYDPNAGTGLGELYQTETITGRPSNFMPGGILHTPSGTVHLGSNGYTQTGNGVPANQSPNFSRTWSFDISANCDQQFLDFGFCTGDGQVGDYCPILPGLFLSFLHGMEFEDAITGFFINANERGGVPTCSPQSSPPDWPGLFQSPDYSQVDRMYRARTGCIRICANPPCTGKPWICTGAARVYKEISTVGPPQHCTNKDAGYISDKNVTY